MRPLALGLLALFLPAAAFAVADVYPEISFYGRAVSGQPFETYIYARNCCNEQVHGGRLTLELPPELGLTAGAPCTMNGNVAECPLATLWSGSGIILHLRGIARAENTRTVAITATITPQFPDANPANNTLRAEVLVLAEPDLSVWPSHQIEPEEIIVAGGSTTFRVNVTNVGTEARDVRLRLVPHGAELEAVLGHGWDCSAAGGDSADCVRPSLGYAHGSEVLVRVRTTGPGASRARLDAEVTSAGSDFSEGNDRKSLEFDVYRPIVVDNAEDSGPGSLRNAIEVANAECASGPCQIRFALPPRTDWYTIEPRTPLPAIAADGLILDARTQHGWTNMNPRIALDGHRLESGDGLVLSSRCSASISGFAIGNFPGNGIVANSPEDCEGRRKRIFENRIGSDPTGEWPWPNTRGVVASGKGIYLENNVIGGNRRSGIVLDGEQLYLWRNIVGGLLPNGASGVYATPRASGAFLSRNIIADNADMGVAVAEGARNVEVRQNTLLRNGGLGLDVGLDGPTPHAPQILGVSRIDEYNLAVTLVAHVDEPFTVDLYANDGPDGEGEQYLGSAYFPRSDGTPFEVHLYRSYVGQWINATVTRFRGNTTEFSNTVQVP